MLFKFELSEAAILATKPTRILSYRPQVTHLWVFSIMKGMEYMTSHMISHFIECHLLSTKETRNFIFAGSSMLHCCLWSYHMALYYLISEHSSGSTPPSIPGQLLVQMFITKEEEKAPGISEHDTVDWRRQNNIPDSDKFELGIQEEILLQESM